MEIIFSTGRHAGMVKKQPAIQTNEGPPQRRVAIQADIVRQPDSTYPIIIHPAIADFPMDPNEAEKPVDISITNVSDTDLRLQAVSLDSRFFGVEFPEIIKSGETATCTFTLTTDALTQSFEKSVTVELDDLNKSRFTIPVEKRAGRSITTPRPEPKTTGSK